MTVYRSREKWRAEVFVNGKRVAAKGGFEKEREAKRWHDETVVRYRSAPVDCRMGHTFDEALSRFELYHLPTVRTGTRVRYVVDVKYRIRPFFRYLKLDDLTPELLESFKLDIASKIKPKSVNNCLHLLRLILNKAVKYRLIHKNPYCLDSVQVPKGNYPWWEHKLHISRFLEEAKKSRYYTVYLLALETGMRYGEIVGLNVADVDLEQGTIHVHQQWLEREKVLGPTKGGEARWIDFEVAGLLGQRLRHAIGTRKKVEPLFVTQKNRRPFKSGLADKFFKAVQRRAGVPLICFHGLRHTFASWYMREHDNVWALKSILGHADIKTTQRYAHHSKRDRQKPLNMASVITHHSRTDLGLRVLTSEDHKGKEWRDGRDLNPLPSRRVSN